MNASRLVTVLLLALPLPVACGGSSDGGGGGSGPIARADAPAVFAELLCTSVGPCCEAAGLDYRPDSCKQIYLGELTAQWDVPNTIWDADAAGRCFDEAREALASCSNIPGNECAGLLTGTLPAGAACTHSAQCVVPAGGDAHCDEVCVQEPRGKAGDGCQETCTENERFTECSGGGPVGGTPGPATCYTNDGLYCAESGRCEALLQAGDACNYDGCAAGTYCDQVCTPFAALGTPCASYDACGDDAYCDVGSSVCSPKKPVGAACVEYDECIKSYCDDSGKCPVGGPATEETCSGI